MAYSHDFRCKVLAVREPDHLSIAQAAERFVVGSASVTRWLKRVERKPSGSLSPPQNARRSAQSIADPAAGSPAHVVENPVNRPSRYNAQYYSILLYTKKLTDSPAEQITALLFTQLFPSSTHALRPQLRQLVYQALVD